MLLSKLLSMYLKLSFKVLENKLSINCYKVDSKALQQILVDVLTIINRFSFFITFNLFTKFYSKREKVTLKLILK